MTLEEGKQEIAYWLGFYTFDDLIRVYRQYGLDHKIPELEKQAIQLMTDYNNWPISK